MWLQVTTATTERQAERGVQSDIRESEQEDIVLLMLVAFYCKLCWTVQELSPSHSPSFANNKIQLYLTNRKIVRDYELQNIDVKLGKFHGSLRQLNLKSSWNFLKILSQLRLEGPTLLVCETVPVSICTIFIYYLLLSHIQGAQKWQLKVIVNISQ